MTPIWKCFFISLTFFKLSSATDHVPVLIWSTNSSLWNRNTAEYEGHIMSKQELNRLLQPIYTQASENLVLFLQDKLSIDDFTRYSRAHGDEHPFQSVQDFLQTSGSAMVLPAVNWRAIHHLIEQMETNDKWNVVSINGMELPDVKTPSSKNTLFLVTLPPVNRINDKSTLKTLTENDKIIRNVISALNNKGISYSAIYTAERPSATYQRMDAAVQTGRRLMAATTVSYPPLNVTNGTDTCIIFYATNFTITANQTNMIDLTALTFTTGNVNTSASECASTNTTLSLKYQNPLTGFNGIEIRFNMQNKFYTGSARNWFTLDTMEIIQDNGQTAVFNVSIVSAPAEYSFHCQEVGTSSRYGAVLTPANSVAQQWSVYIYEFQIQGFNVNGGLFSYASDCTSFFTAPIWMAIVTCLVLLYIVTYGLHMIMQLTTNEKFDDPKGQPLSVPQTE